MTAEALGPAYVFNKDAGRGWVNDSYERVAIFVKEYDPELELGWIPPANREPDDLPFCIIHNHPNGTRQVISYWSEAQINIDTIGLWLMENDFNKNNPNEIFDRIQAAQLAHKLAEAKEIEDEAAAKWEWGISLLKSPLHWYKHDGKTYRS